MDKKRFAVMMGAVFAAFRCDASKETMAVYFEYLKDQDVEAVRHAVDESIKTLERFPTVAKMREFAGAWRRPVNYTPSSAPMIEEFTKEEIERCKSMSFDDIIKNTAERMTV